MKKENNKNNKKDVNLFTLYKLHKETTKEKSNTKRKTFLWIKYFRVGSIYKKIIITENIFLYQKKNNHQFD